MAIEVLNETSYDLDIQRVVSLGQHLYANLHIAPESELAVVFIDNDAMSPGLSTCPHKGFLATS